MYVWSRVTSSAVIGSGGLALHFFVLRLVIVFWSGWMSLACNPFSPCISIGLSPVWAIMSSFSDSSLCAAAISIDIFSLVGGCMLTGSGV